MRASWSRAAIGVTLAAALAIVAACSGAPAGSSGQPAGSSASPATAPAGSTAATAATATASTPPPSALSSPTPGPTPTASPTPVPPLTLASPAFHDGAAIPARYTCGGADTSPPLAWSHAPQGTVAFALLVVDTDASGFVHWVVSDIPGDRTSLTAGQRAGVAGRNGFGGVGYGGPCPPAGSGAHHYVFTLYALSHRLGLGGVPTATQVRAAAAHVTLATARLTGTFRR